MIDFDTYETIDGGEHRETIKIQRSDFIGIAFPISGEESFGATLTRVQKEFHGATHHCWAWRGLHVDEIRAQSADAGEPSGTAGRPILQAIESAALIDVGVVVVRYYGGVKLGTGGLARAYRDAARAALAGVTRRRRYLYTRLVVELPYSLLSQVYRLIAPPDVVLVAENFGELNRFELDVRRSMAAAIETELEEKRIAFRRAPLPG